ncbi:MAG: hypothetical protein HEP71_03395 [Roseivirga sp.]|nr:hypothetical protein [Roseivirga sp.]
MATIKNPTLILGLGGTGFLTASKIKSIAQEIFDNGHPDSLKFLCIDFDKSENNLNQYSKVFTDETSPIEASGDRSREWLRLSSGRDVDYERAMRTPASGADVRFFEPDLRRRSELLNSIGGFDLSVGAGQKRVLGKIGISYSTNYKNVKSKIQDTIRPLEMVNIQGAKEWDTISIYVINSFSGGAGAGMFLDILFMLNDMNIEGKKLEILTFNFLPDVFLNGVSKNIFKNLVEPNTYAAITELEYIYSNVDNFRPTHYKQSLGTRRNLPKANFLINQTSYNGSKLGMKSMLYSTAKTISNLLLAGNGLDRQWSNYQAEMAGNIKGKNRIFCSLGYTEIVFNPSKLMDYVTRAILSKAWNDYNSSASDSANSLNKSDIDIFQQIENFLENPVENLLTGKPDENFSSQLEKLEYKKPPVSKKLHEKLKESLGQNSLMLEASLKTLVGAHYDNSKLSDLIGVAKEKVKVSSFKKSELDDQVAELRERLLTYKSTDKSKRSLKEKRAEFKRKFESIVSDLDKIPRRYKGLFGTKSDYYKSYLPGKVDSLKNLINLSLKEIVVGEELIRLFDNDIERNLVDVSNIENKDFEKLEWINSNLATLKMPENYDNVIFLESFFRQEIDLLIAADADVNADLIKQYLSADIPFSDCIRNLLAVQKTYELESMDIYQLKQELDQERVEHIVKKVDELIEPLWDRENDDQINNASIYAGGNLRSYERLEVPRLGDGTIGEYFGQDSFSINEGDIYPSQQKHRQSIIKLELGLPAYLVKSVARYKSTYDDEVNNMPNLSVNFFAYDEIRKKYNNGEIGIFVFEDDEEFSKRQRAYYAWAFGWALKLISKDQGRFKFKVTPAFKPAEENRHKLNNYLYDPFRELGTSADLLKLFNEFKDDNLLIADIERSIESERAKTTIGFINRVAVSFDATTSTDPNQKFRTEKKARTTLTDAERAFLDIEQETLRSGTEEIANAASVRIDWIMEPVGHEMFLRLRVRND